MGREKSVSRHSSFYKKDQLRLGECAVGLEANRSERNSYFKINENEYSVNEKLFQGLNDENDSHVDDVTVMALKENEQFPTVPPTSELLTKK